MRTFRYLVKGTSADEQTWETSGEIVNPGDLATVCSMIARESFVQLTNGRAVYGSPGVGCRGPYTIKSFSWEDVSDEKH